MLLEIRNVNYEQTEKCSVVSLDGYVFSRHTAAVQCASNTTCGVAGNSKSLYTEINWFRCRDLPCYVRLPKTDG